MCLVFGKLKTSWAKSLLDLGHHVESGLYLMELA